MELVKFELAELQRPQLEGSIMVNPNHVTAVHFLEAQQVTAIFCSNFQIFVKDDLQTAIKRLGFRVNQSTQTKE